VPLAGFNCQGPTNNSLDRADMGKNTDNGAHLGFENDLWRAADALRSNMDAAEYKHVVLGLIFLKYISDSFEEQHAKLEAERAAGADPEDLLGPESSPLVQA
jgi:type I restriction enzyme M protein